MVSNADMAANCGHRDPVSYGSGAASESFALLISLKSWRVRAEACPILARYP
jgi:hypothetical protein